MRGRRLKMSNLAKQIPSAQMAGRLVPEVPALKILSGQFAGKQFRLLAQKITIGRDNSCDIILKNNSRCSPRHALLRKKTSQLYSIESLDKKNPVFVNKKPLLQHDLKKGDEIIIGNIKLAYLEKSSMPTFHKKTASTKKKFNPLSVLLVGILGIGLFYANLDEQKVSSKIPVKTQGEIDQEVRELQALQKLEIEKTQSLPVSLEARRSFISGFRDYRKGYYDHAVRAFNHCLTVDPRSSICASYVRKSRSQIDKIIQANMQLGKSYIDNLQFLACVSVFKKVEIMLRDKDHPVFKEAKANRFFCQGKIKNKL